MATLEGTVHSVHTLKSDAVGKVQLAEVLFTVTGTYVQADNATLLGVADLIEDSRRNGKTVTMIGVAPSQAATSTDGDVLSLKTVAIDTTAVDFEITLNSPTTEFTNSTALPTLSRPFGIVVAFEES